MAQILCHPKNSQVGKVTTTIENLYAHSENRTKRELIPQSLELPIFLRRLKAVEGIRMPVTCMVLPTCSDGLHQLICYQTLRFLW